jgi:cytochrome oxidase Cu insertion factor (SCO1/SenC/PrrC family)
VRGAPERKGNAKMNTEIRHATDLRMNEDYEKMFKRYQKTKWVSGFFCASVTNKKFCNIRYSILERMHKDLFPRRKKINVDNIPMDINNKLNERLAKRAKEYYELVKASNKKYEDWLNENAPKIEIEKKDKFVDVDWLYGGTYTSQGYGADRYSRNHFNNDQTLLDANGIENRVVQREKHGSYYLMAKCEKYILDALRRIDDKDLLTKCVDIWKSGTNPKVVYPLLPQSLFDESLKIYMGKDNVL